MNTWSDDLDRSAAMLVIEAAAGAWGLNTKGPEDPTTPQLPPALLGPSTSAEAMFSAIMARISGVLGVWVRPVNSYFSKRLVECERLRKKLCDEMFCFSLMHRQCSLH